MTEHEFAFETKAIHVGQEGADPATDARAVPIYQTTSYVFHDAQDAADRFALRAPGNIYGRLTNPTQGIFEERIAALEGGIAGVATASGAAAITSVIQALAQQGAHVVAQKTIYGGTINLLEYTLAAFGISTTFVDIHDLDEVEAAFQENTCLVFAETLGNPHSDIPDIDAVAALAHAHGTTLGGVIVDGGKFDWAASGKYPQFTEVNPSYGVPFAEAAGPAALATYIRAILLRDTGACISPFNAFLLLQGTETLAVRLDRHNENAKRVVEFLVNHPKVAKVNHPSLPDHPQHDRYLEYFPNGAASIFTFEVAGDQEATFRFIDSLKLFSLLANVADVKSLVVHPYTTTHAELSPEELASAGITPSTVRLSIGCESADDIIWDLDQALSNV